MIHIGSDTQYFEKEFPTHWQTGEALFIDKEKNMFGKQHSFSNKVKEKIKQQLEQYLDIQLAEIDMETTYLHSPFKQFDASITIAVVGRYISNNYAYLSILDALKASAVKAKRSI